MKFLEIKPHSFIFFEKENRTNITILSVKYYKFISETFFIKIGVPGETPIKEYSNEISVNYVHSEKNSCQNRRYCFQFVGIYRSYLSIYLYVCVSKVSSSKHDSWKDDLKIRATNIYWTENDNDVITENYPV